MRGLLPASARLWGPLVPGPGSQPLCLQIDQPTLGMPSREYYFYKGSNQKVSPGRAPAASPCPACPLCSGPLLPSLQGPLGPNPHVYCLALAPHSEHLDEWSLVLTAEDELCNLRRDCPQTLGDQLSSAHQLRGTHPARPISPSGLRSTLPVFCVGPIETWMHVPGPWTFSLSHSAPASRNQAVAKQAGPGPAGGGESWEGRAGGVK